MAKYDHQSVDAVWQQRWAAANAGAARDAEGEKMYLLVEFPYPSGDGLHVGHLRSYTAMDVIARKRRMEGKNVLYPIGWDAFGLPAENYAIKTGQHPRVTTERNIANFRRQLQAAGFSFDWSREVNTTDPAYYKWTQWIFLKLLEHGLAYKATIPINWCPSCKIGLANEEVVGGRCERCGGGVTLRDKEQWMLKITAYADKLLEGLEHVDYIERAKVQQRNWIGRSEGAEITFALRGIPGQENDKHRVTVFTTRPDTLFGATFLVVSPEVAQQWIDVGWQAPEDVRAYLAAARQKTEMDRAAEEREKTGVFSGVTAVNPANHEAIPVWVADYVLGSYGTGAIMAVPAHDERDFAFARKYGLPIRVVIARESATEAIPANQPYSGVGILLNSAEFDGMTNDDAKGVITKHVSGKMTVTYKLRDWVFSRQRYWGEPIPVVFCAQCGTVPVPEDQLPVVLPEAEKYQPTDSGESPLASIAEWVNTNCPRCGGAAKRETDVMPNWAGSSWYFLRYCDPHNDRALADTGKLASWMPVDWYNGGMEHTTLHLLYSRFWNLFLHDIGAVPMAEPYAKRTSHGMILAANGEKMSKSRGNVVNPDTIIAQYGADTVRVYEMFIGPFDQAVPWSENGLVGCRRFLEKLWGARERVEARPAGNQCTSTDRLLHRTIKKVSEDIEAMRFNTAIAAMMEYVNDLVQRERIAYFDFVTFLALLAPFAPHLCEELHAELEAGSGGEQAGHSIFAHPWPQYDPALIVETEVELVVQVNGKLRAILRVSTDITEADATARALAELNVIKQLAGAQPKKIVFVPGRLINVVV